MQDRTRFPFRTDVVIIGAGIIGVTTAYFLAKRGLKVVICDKGRVACEQSGRNWGWVRKMGRDPAEIPLSLASADLWRKMNELVGKETGFRETGIFYLCKTEKEVSKYNNWMVHARTHGIDSKVLSSAELTDRLPTLNGKWQGALFTPSDGKAEPSLAAGAIATAATELGVEILEHTAVRGIELSGGRVGSVVTEHGEIKCSQTVVACGAWTRLFFGNMGIDFPQLKVVGSVIRTKPLPGAPTYSVAGTDFAFRKRLDGGYTIAQKNANMVEIVPDSFRLFFRFLPAFRSEGNEIRLRLSRRFFDEAKTPTRWNMDDVSPFEMTRTLNPAPSPGILKEGLRNLTRAFPEFKSVEPVESWGCAIDVTPDAVPVIDEIESMPGLFVASGFSGHGFGIAPGAAHLMADLVAGAKPIVDPDPFKFSRIGRYRNTHE